MWPCAEATPLRLNLPGSACSSHPASKRSVLSRAWAFSRHSIYTPQPGMWCSGDPGLGRAFAQRSCLGRVSLFLGTLVETVETAASLGQGHTGLAWKGWGQRLAGSHFSPTCLLLVTVGFRLPLKLVISATLTGTATYQVCPTFCSARCP